jgi:cation diffusion facilitator family transporter
MNLGYYYQKSPENVLMIVETLTWGHVRMENTEKKSNGMMAIFAALGANILVAISKIVGFALSGSAAMMNESIHSIVDCANQVLLIFGDKRAKKSESKLHQFGESRAKYFFSTIVATMLFFGGGALGVMESIEKLIGHEEHEVASVFVIMAILVVDMIIEGSSLHVAFKEIHELNTEKLPLFKFLKQSRHSEILIIFAEDSCAVIGLTLALLGTILTAITGNPFFDALSGLLIGLLLMIAAIFLAREFYSLMIGESVTPADLAKIENLLKRDDIERVIDIKTVHMGPTDILIAAKIDFDDAQEAKAYDIINQIEADIRKEFSDYKVYIYIEADEFDEHYETKHLA